MPAGVFKSETENSKDIFGIVCSAKTSEQNNFGIPFWKAVDQSIYYLRHGTQYKQVQYYKHVHKKLGTSTTVLDPRGPTLHDIRPVQLFAIINNQANRI